MADQHVGAGIRHRVHIVLRVWKFGMSFQQAALDQSAHTPVKRRPIEFVQAQTHESPELFVSDELRMQNLPKQRHIFDGVYFQCSLSEISFRGPPKRYERFFRLFLSAIFSGEIPSFL